MLCILNIPAFCQLDKYGSYEELDSLTMVYFQANNFDSIILVNEYARTKYPEKDEYLTMILTYFYNQTKQDDKVLGNLDYGIKKRYFLEINDWDYEQLKDNPEFNRVVKANTQIGDSLNQFAHVEYKVVLPTDYSKDKTYPVLFVLHGNNRNIQESSFVSDLIQDKFIVVYMQSCIHMSTSEYQWVLNDEKTNKEFKEIYERIIKEYPINQNKVIFAAMSMGGVIAIDYAFNQFLPVYGLVLNCPVIPQVSDSSIHAFANKNKKIAIITGEKDWAIIDQKGLITKVDSLDGNSKIRVNIGLGHEFPVDFSPQLDEYLNWILE